MENKSLKNLKTVLQNLKAHNLMTGQVLCDTKSKAMKDEEVQ